MVGMKSLLKLRRRFGVRDFTIGRSCTWIAVANRWRFRSTKERNRAIQRNMIHIMALKRFKRKVESLQRPFPRPRMSVIVSESSRKSGSWRWR